MSFLFEFSGMGTPQRLGLYLFGECFLYKLNPLLCNHYRRIQQDIRICHRSFGDGVLWKEATSHSILTVRRRCSFSKSNTSFTMHHVTGQQLNVSIWVYRKKRQGILNNLRSFLQGQKRTIIITAHSTGVTTNHSSWYNAETNVSPASS